MNFRAMDENRARMGIKLHAILLLISMIFVIANVSYQYLVLNHSYPLAIYPAFIPFLLAFYIVKKQMPTLPVIIVFVLGFSTWTAIVATVLDPLTSRPVDYTLLFEPAWFVAVLLTLAIVRKAYGNNQRFLSW
nr:hypothetical protein [Candidatus Sigynarchaeota archaeon]